MFLAKLEYFFFLWLGMPFILIKYYRGDLTAGYEHEKKKKR